MKPRRLLWLVLLALLLLVYFNAVFLDTRIFAERDLPVFFYPNIIFWLQSVRGGELPLWNPYIMCGEPNLANVQPGFLYPLSVLYLLLPADTAFNLNIVLHFFLAGLFTFVLMKEVGASDQAAALASLLFVFGGYLLSVQNVLSTLLSVAWFPLVFALFIRGMRLHAWRFSVYAALALYCMFAAGGMEIFIMTCGMLLCAAVTPFLYSRGAVAMPLPARMVYGGLVLLSCGVVGAAQILPFAELLRESVRGNGMRYDDAVTWSLMPKNLLYLFVPDVFWRGQRFYWEDQSWLKTLYTGTLPFMLALFFFLKGRRSQKLFVAVVAAAAVFLALGKYNPLYRVLFDWAPLLQTIRYPVKFFFPAVFFLCVAAGLGWDCLRTNSDDRLLHRTAVGLFFLFGFLCSLFYMTSHLNPELFWHWISGERFFQGSHLPQYAILHNIRRCLVMSIAGSTALYLVVRLKAFRRPGWYGVAGVLLFDLFAGNYGYYVAVKRETLHGVTGNMEVLLKDDERCRFFVPWDIIRSEVSFSDFDDLLWQHKDFFVGNTLAEHRRFSTFGFPVLMLRRYYELFAIPYNTPLPDTTGLLNMLNVKYVLWPTELDRPGYVLVRKGRFHLYRNDNRLPRAFLVPQYQVLSGDRETCGMLANPSFNPAQTVLLDSAPDFGRSAAGAEQTSGRDSGGMPDTVQITRYRNNEIALDVVSSRKQMLFLSETFYPGWTASVDGSPARIHRANHAFRAVAVTPGRHTVTFRYDPWSFQLGVVISMVGVVGMLIALYGAIGNTTFNRRRFQAGRSQ